LSFADGSSAFSLEPSGFRHGCDACICGYVGVWGVFDKEFQKASRAFFEEVRAGGLQLVVSGLVEDELRDAPKDVRNTWTELMALAEFREVTDKAMTLCDAYLNAGVVTPKWKRDCLHVAVATVAQCAMIVSWNFRHIVNYRKIHHYNAVNAMEGYAMSWSRPGVPLRPPRLRVEGTKRRVAERAELRRGRISVTHSVTGGEPGPKLCGCGGRRTRRSKGTARCRERGGRSR